MSDFQYLSKMLSRDGWSVSVAADVNGMVIQGLENEERRPEDISLSATFTTDGEYVENSATLKLYGGPVLESDLSWSRLLEQAALHGPRPLSY